MKEDLIKHLPPAHPGPDHVHWFDTIDSTNTYAKALAQSGAPQGTVVIADRQTGGRGRMGRSFSSPGGMGIYLSMILRPECEATELMHLTCAVAVAMCDAVEGVSGFRPQVKWINDLMAKGKKLGGILTELSLVPGTASVDFAVVGIGINCFQAVTDFPDELQNIAISLQDVIGNPVDRAKLAAAMIESLWKMSRTLLVEKSAIMTKYKADCITLGQDIYLLQGDEKHPCHAVDIDSEGALIVQYPDGARQAVNSGEVSVRPR